MVRNLSTSAFHLSDLPDADEVRLSYALEVRPALEFAYDTGLTKLLTVPVCVESDREAHMAFLTPGDADMNETDVVGNVTGYSGRKEKLLQLSSKVDLESRISIGCAGAVLSCLHRRKAVNQLLSTADAQSVFQISTISMFNLNKTM